MPTNSKPISLTRARRKKLAADFFHAQRNFDVGLGADAEIVVARAHAAAETHLPHYNVRLSPRTGERGGSARQHDAFVAALADPGTSRAGIERGDGKFGRLKAAFRERLSAMAGINLGERLNRGDAQFAVLGIAEHFLRFSDGAQNRNSLGFAQTAQRLDGL